MGFYLVPFRQLNPPTRFLSITGHRNVSLPSGASLWNGMFGRVGGQNTIPVLWKPYVDRNIIIKGQRLKLIEKFTNLSTFYKSVVMDNELNTRLAKASVVFGWLNRNGWNRRGIRRQLKSRFTELSFCETWTTYQRYTKNSNHFRTTCLMKIQDIT